MVGYKMNTVRSADKPRHRRQQIAEFCSPGGDAQIFLGNVNTCSTGLNLHHKCHKGIIVSFHHNMKLIIQVMCRLHRIGQLFVVEWHLLKTKNSFHDYQERQSVSKWARQISAEANLPDYLEGPMRELVIFELQKAYMGQPFNRYAWIVLRDISDKDIEYYADATIKLGHACSAVAKMLASLKGNEIGEWRQIQHSLVAGLISVVEDYTVEEAEAWLISTEETLRNTLRKIFFEAAEEAKTHRAQDTENLEAGVQKRQKDYKSPEFIDSDMENELDEDERVSDSEEDVEEAREDSGEGDGEPVDSDQD